MTAPAQPAATDAVLSHELALEVDLSATEVPEWVKVPFTSAIDPQIAPTTEDATTYDDEGTTREERIGEDWTLPFTLNRYRDATGAYLPAHEVFRKAADPGVRGDEAKVRVRWFDKGGADEAYEGEATVTWKRGNTNAKGLGTATVTLKGSGRLTPIENPVPTVPAG